MDSRISEALAKLDEASVRYIERLQELASDPSGMPVIMPQAHAFYKSEAWIDDAVDHLRRVLEFDQSLRTADAQIVRQAIAKCYMLRGEYASALIDLRDALNLQENSTSDERALWIIGDMGLCQRGLGHLPEAIRSFERGRALAELLENEAMIKFMLENLGDCYRQVAELAQTKSMEGYVTQASMRDIRSIHEITWQVPIERAHGWHVILGDNGSGKTSFLRSIALALIGSRDAAGLRQDFGRWQRSGSETGQIDLTLSLWPTKQVYEVLSRTQQGEVVPPAERGESGAFLPLDLPLGLELRREGPEVRLEERAPYKRTFWELCGGVFSAAYGPFRRFADADLEYERIVSAQPRVGRHISLFDSRVTLAESITWLHQLKLKKLDGRPEGALLEPFTQLLNDPGPPSFLPHGARLEDASTTTMHVVDGEGASVPFEDLSDGHRAVLSLQFDLIRHMAAAFGPSNVFSPEERTIVLAGGIVLIDEIDVHLHPTWQQRIGFWFKRHFPNVQFIVTTHSPLVCQAADSVFVLPTPGADGEARMLKGVELDRVRYGNVLEAYGTDVFGRGVTRSNESRKMLRRLVELNRKELEQGLSDGEREEQQRLRAILPTAAPLVSTSNGGGT